MDINKLRAAQNRNTAPLGARLVKKEPPPKKPAEKPAPPPKAEAPPKPEKPVVVHKCGHTRHLTAMRHEHCPQCQRKLRAEATARKRGTGKPRFGKEHSRLPHGARFDVQYDAERQEWTGTLTVDGRIYSGTVSGVFALLGKLDGDFRNDLAKRTQEGG